MTGSLLLWNTGVWTKKGPFQQALICCSLPGLPRLSPPAPPARSPLQGAGPGTWEQRAAVGLNAGTQLLILLPINTSQGCEPLLGAFPKTAFPKTAFPAVLLHGTPSTCRPRAGFGGFKPCWKLYLGLSCAEPGVGPDAPVGSFQLMDILWFTGFFSLK